MEARGRLARDTTQHFHVHPDFIALRPSEHDGRGGADAIGQDGRSAPFFLSPTVDGPHFRGDKAPVQDSPAPVELPHLIQGTPDRGQDLLSQPLLLLLLETPMVGGVASVLFGEVFPSRSTLALRLSKRMVCGTPPRSRWRSEVDLVVQTRIGPREESPSRVSWSQSAQRWCPLGIQDVAGGEVTKQRLV